MPNYTVETKISSFLLQGIVLIILRKKQFYSSFYLLLRSIRKLPFQSVRYLLEPRFILKKMVKGKTESVNFLETNFQSNIFYKILPGVLDKNLSFPEKSS
jgi:hypothetical protein